MSDHSDLGRFIEPVARALFGEPNKRLSSKTSLRFGTHGSMDIDIKKGIAYSHEDSDGGGVLWLIRREKGLEGPDAFKFLREIGCDVQSDNSRQQLPEANRQAPHGDAPAKIVATYDYQDEDGTLLFQVCRFEPKTFRQRCPGDGGDGWSYKVQGVKQVPYMLPELQEDLSQDRTIFIVEGEKDVRNLRKIGVPATCNAGGAGKWPDTLTAYFRGADVVIIQDNDPQARNKDGDLRFYPEDHAEFPNQPIHPGQDHAEFVARRLNGTAKSIRVLALPNLPLKGDVSDWIAAGGTSGELYALASAAPKWTRRPERIVSHFGGLRWNDIGNASTMLKYSWLVEDIIPLGEITLVYGESGSGKSFGIFAMCVNVAKGEQFAGRNVEPGLVIYVAAEAGNGFSKRKIAYAQYYDISDEENVPFYLCTKRPNFFAGDEDVEKLIREINQVAASYGKPPVLIVLDTLSALAPGMNENASQDVSMVRLRLVKLQEQFPNAAIILVHHKPKNGNTPRGHGSLTADFETTIEFEKLQVRDSRGLLVHRAITRKQREGKSGLSWEFTLPVFEVGRNKWGNKEMSCVAVPYNSQRASTGGYRPSRDEKLFLECLFRAINDSPVRTPSGMDPDAHYTEEVNVRRLMKSQMITGEEDQSRADARFRTAFSRAGNALRSAHVIGKRDGIIWYSGAMIHGMTYRVEERSEEDDAA